MHAKMRRSFTIAQKLRVIDQIKQSSISKVSKQLNIHKVMLHRWLKKEEEFRITTQKGTRRQGKSGRTPLYPEEGDVLKMIVEQREKGVPLSWKMIMEWMKELTTDDPGFKASHGWVQRFANRHDLTL
jgi:transposase-like protein